MIVKQRFAPSFLISCNLVQFRGFSGLHVLGSSRFLPSLSRVARLHKKDICLQTRLFKMDAEQNRFLLRSILCVSFLVL